MAHLSQVVLRGGTHREGPPNGTPALSYLLVPLDQPGVEIRPIVQLTGTADFKRGGSSTTPATDADLVGR